MSNAFVVVNPKKETDVISTHVPPAIRNPRPSLIPITCDLTDFFPFVTQPPQHHLLVYPSSIYSTLIASLLTFDYSIILCIFHPVYTLRTRIASLGLRPFILSIFSTFATVTVNSIINGDLRFLFGSGSPGPQ